VFHPDGFPALAANLITDEIERHQTKGWSKGRIPKMKNPLVDWGPLRLRADGKTRIHRSRRAREKRRERRRKRVRASASLKLSRDLVYGELRFRF
jgi:hypothetical protein